MLQSVTIGNKNCLLHTNKRQEQAVVVFIQLTARHENKSQTDEMVALDNNIHVPYLFVGVKLDSWAQCLMPWADEAVSHDEEVGRHAIILYRKPSATMAKRMCRYGTLCDRWLFVRRIVCVMGSLSF